MQKHNDWQRFAGQQFRLLIWIAGVSVMGLAGCQSLACKDCTSEQTPASAMPVARATPMPTRSAPEAWPPSGQKPGRSVRLVSDIFPVANDGQSAPVVTASISDAPVSSPDRNRVDWNGLLAAARELEANGNLLEAIHSYQPFLDQTDIPATVYHRLGVLYDKSGQKDLADPMFKRALELAPNNADLLCDLGYRQHLAGDSLIARDYYQKALSVDSENARAHNHLAVMLLNNGGDEALAMDHFRKAGLSWFQARQNIRYIQASPKPE